MRSMKIATCTALITTAVILGSACKPRQDVSATRDLNRGQKASYDDSLFNDPKMKSMPIVLIYYANDTYAPHPSNSMDEIKNSFLLKLDEALTDPSFELDTAQRQQVEKVRDRVKNDFDMFHQSVREETATLARNICRSNPSRPDLALAIFRNFGNDMYGNGMGGYMRDFQWEYCEPGKTRVIANMEIPTFADDWRYQFQPLSHKITFRKALESVAKVFPMGKYRYILIAKSHGTKEYSIVPHMSRDVRKMATADIIKMITSNKNIGEASLSGEKWEFPILADINDELLKYKSAGETLQPAGITKWEFLTEINNFGGGDPRLGMYFPIVFMEACKSNLGFSTNQNITYGVSPDTKRLKVYDDAYQGLNFRNIGRLFTSDDKGLKYDTINYEQMLSGTRYRNTKDFQNAVFCYLEDVATKSETRPCE